MLARRFAVLCVIGLGLATMRPVASSATAPSPTPAAAPLSAAEFRVKRVYLIRPDLFLLPPTRHAYCC